MGAEFCSDHPMPFYLRSQSEIHCSSSEVGGPVKHQKALWRGEFCSHHVSFPINQVYYRRWLNVYVSFNQLEGVDGSLRAASFTVSLTPHCLLNQRPIEMSTGLYRRMVLLYFQLPPIAWISHHLHSIVILTAYKPHIICVRIILMYLYYNCSPYG